MTVAVCVTVGDGQVLAADSASTVPAPDNPGAVLNIYDHANKVANLRKGLPLGVMFWGSGGIGGLSMETLAKDLRVRLSGDDLKYRNWRIDPLDYSLGQIAGWAYEFFIEEHYAEAYRSWDPEYKPTLGMVIAGYGSNQNKAEAYEIKVSSGGQTQGPTLIQGRESSAGVNWWGEPEAITRLMKGMGSALPSVMRDSLGVPDDQVGPAVDELLRNLELTLVHPAMPIQDAIDLADFLVETTKQFTRFLPGAPTVGGPTEVAAITRHEGFKWVKRKHYYPPELNPWTYDPRSNAASPISEEPSGESGEIDDETA